jgi:TATA-binding protein-associated factor
LIFAQFTRSLDVVEEFLLKPHMPSLRYLRLDGRVPARKRTELVDSFNRDPSIKLMLLTTRAGGLGLNLTGKWSLIA